MVGNSANARSVAGQRFVYTVESVTNVGIAVVIVSVIMDVNAASVAIVVDLKFAATGANVIIVKTVGDRRSASTLTFDASAENVESDMFQRFPRTCVFNNVFIRCIR